MRRLSVLCFSSCFTGALLALAADRAAAQRLPRLTYEEYRLDNGLRVILAPNPRAAVVAVDLTYDVGSRNEEKGRTGFAHLFEHMLFEGSAGLARGEVYKILEGAGSLGFNASTTEDRTNYYQPLPADRLNLGLWLTADRMRGPRIDSASFAREREIVKEERRLKVDNQAYALLRPRARHARRRGWLRAGEREGADPALLRRHSTRHGRRRSAADVRRRIRRGRATATRGGRQGAAPRGRTHLHGPRVRPRRLRAARAARERVRQGRDVAHQPHARQAAEGGGRGADGAQ